MILEEIRDKLRADYNPEFPESVLLDQIKSVFVKTISGNPLRSFDDVFSLIDTTLRVSSISVSVDPSGNGAKITWWPLGLGGAELRAESVGYCATRALMDCILTLFIDTAHADVSDHRESGHEHAQSSARQFGAKMADEKYRVAHPSYPFEVFLHSTEGWRRLPHPEIMDEIEERTVLAFGQKASVGNFAATQMLVPGVIPRSGHWTRIGTSFYFERQADAQSFYDFWSTPRD